MPKLARHCILRAFKYVILSVSLMSCHDPACFDLIYDEILDTCVCPPGTMPNFELGVCEGDGRVIPWGDIMVAYPQPDAGMSDSSVQDSGMDMMSTDAGSDRGMDVGPPSTDAGSDRGVDGTAPVDAGMDSMMDAGPPPPATFARFPWNGITTGSVHTPADADIVDHPLMPRFVWERVADVDYYHVQMTRDCDLAAFRSCTFSTPDLDVRTEQTSFRPDSPLSVEFSRPVGARYFWRVRSCGETDICSDWTETRYIDVGRHMNDFNGDGYADIVVGASEQWMRMGVAYAFYGGPAGVPSMPSVTLRLSEPQDFAGFGFSVASADVNADGFVDVIVGAPGVDGSFTGEGKVYIFLGGPLGVQPTPSVILDSPNAQVSGGFGEAVSAAGDVNGDGFADVMVGAYHQDGTMENSGNAYLYYGAADTLRPMPGVTLRPDAEQRELWAISQLPGGHQW